MLVLLYQTQSSLLYHPEMPGNERLYVAYPPGGFDFEEDTITTEDNVHLHCYFVKQSSESLRDVPTLIYFHGNAGNIGSPCYVGLYTRCGVNILLVEYRGYDLSTGSPSEEGFYYDGEAAVEYL